MSQNDWAQFDEEQWSLITSPRRYKRSDGADKYTWGVIYLSICLFALFSRGHVQTNN